MQLHFWYTNELFLNEKKRDGYAIKNDQWMPINKKWYKNVCKKNQTIETEHKYWLVRKQWFSINWFTAHFSFN